LVYSYGSQSLLAAEFFQEVKGTQEGDPRTGNAILTGHSLGGGPEFVPPTTMPEVCRVSDLEPVNANGGVMEERCAVRR